jgi:hypothetical protein
MTVPEHLLLESAGVVDPASNAGLLPDMPWAVPVTLGVDPETPHGEVDLREANSDVDALADNLAEVSLTPGQPLPPGEGSQQKGASTKGLEERSWQELKAQADKWAGEERYAEAVDTYTAAISLTSAEPALFSNRAYMYNQLGKHKQAVSDCNKALKLDPTWVRAYIRKAQAWLSQNQAEEANTVICAGLEQVTEIYLYGDATEALPLHLPLTPTPTLYPNRRTRRTPRRGSWKQHCDSCSAGLGSRSISSDNMGRRPRLMSLSRSKLRA